MHAFSPKFHDFISYKRIKVHCIQEYHNLVLYSPVDVHLGSSHLPALMTGTTGSVPIGESLGSDTAWVHAHCGEIAESDKAVLALVLPKSLWSDTVRIHAHCGKIVESDKVVPAIVL